MGLNLEVLEGCTEATLQIRHKSSRSGMDLSLVSKLCLDGQVLGRISSHVDYSGNGDTDMLKKSHVDYFVEILRDSKYKPDVSGNTIKLTR